MCARKILVLTTAFLAALLLVLLAVWHARRLPERVIDPITLRARGDPFLGNPSAEIQFVAFEDFRCYHCYLFNKNVFPEIQKSYLDTKKAGFTFVSIAFLEGSKPIANAALAVHHRSPERFFPYALALFTHFHEGEEEASSEALLQVAKEVGGIDLADLEKCIKEKCFYGELNANFLWAKKVMHGDVHTPVLYIDGRRSPTTPFSKVKAQVKRISKTLKKS